MEATKEISGIDNPVIETSSTNKKQNIIEFMRKGLIGSLSDFDESEPDEDYVTSSGKLDGNLISLEVAANSCEDREISELVKILRYKLNHNEKIQTAYDSVRSRRYCVREYMMCEYQDIKEARQKIISSSLKIRLYKIIDAYLAGNKNNDASDISSIVLDDILDRVGSKNKTLDDEQCTIIHNGKYLSDTVYDEIMEAIDDIKCSDDFTMFIHKYTNAFNQYYKYEK